MGRFPKERSTKMRNYYKLPPALGKFAVEKYKKVKDGFNGINFHYLPPILRAKLMDALYTTVNNKTYDATTKVRISYDILKGVSKFRLFKPTLKKYLRNHIRSNFLQVSSSEWDIALFLPTENFKKANKDQVWADSRKKVG